ncbi:MAG: C25 family cysteine peptidase, partial [Thermoplasmatota archaeon]
MRGFTKTLIAIAVPVLLLGSGIAGLTGQMSLTHTTDTESMTTSATFSLQPSPLTIEPASDEYVNVHLADASATTMNEGEPMLPYITKTMTFPVGTHIQDVEVTLGDVTTRQLDAPIAPASTPLPTNMQHVESVQQMGPIYDSDALYPSTWMQWNAQVGLHQGEHMIFLTLQAFPARYAPQANELHIVDHIDVEVTYDLPTTALLTADEYDLLIIAPAEFTDALQPLVQHKEDHNVATKLVTLDDVYAAAQGRDEAEQIKYYIKDAIEDLGVTYVMLVGGRNGGLLQEKWWCPVRYTHLNAGDGDKRFLSDLYFADVYRYVNGSAVFESWDTNDNDLFGEMAAFGGKVDDLDLLPDVYLGRLACRNVYEVNVMVDKIITYETTAAGSDWANRYVGIGGDTFPGDQWYDGEESVAKVIEYLDPLGIDSTTLFTSDGTLSEGQDIIDAVSEGCGFLNFEGHGNPMSWANHPPQDGD